MTEFWGGAANHELRIMQDGATLRISLGPDVGGRLSALKLDSLRKLLESDRLHREAEELAAAQADQPSCDAADRSTELRMGALRIVQRQGCDRGVRTPTMDRLNRLLEEIWHGEVVERLGPGEPRFEPITVQSVREHNLTGARIEITGDRAAVWTAPFASPIRGTIPEPQFDALRMICAGELCHSDELPVWGHLVTIGDRDPIAIELNYVRGECLAAMTVARIATDAVRQ